MTSTVSNWQQRLLESDYHFDNDKFDDRWDTAIHLGCIKPTWQDDVEQIENAARPMSWKDIKLSKRTTVEQQKTAEQEFVSEEYDLNRWGFKPDHVMANISFNLPKKLKQVADQFALRNLMARVHVQKPGGVWPLHLDNYNKGSYPDIDKDSIFRIIIHLTDWQPGQFWNYGNYMHSHWHAGDVVTFDWLHVPHSTANAGHYPRATLNIVGIKTPETEEFLLKLKNTSHDNPLVIDEETNDQQL